MDRLKLLEEIVDDARCRLEEVVAARTVAGYRANIDALDAAIDDARWELERAEENFRDEQIDRGLVALREIIDPKPIVTSLAESLKVLVQIQNELRREGIRV